MEETEEETGKQFLQQLACYIMKRENIDNMRDYRLGLKKHI